MTQFASIITEIVTPDSDSDINLELYEWYLVWSSREGTPCSWLFTDWEAKNAVDATPINITDSNYITSLINTEDRIITLTAEDITFDELEAFQDLQISKNVWRAYRKDSTNFEAGGVEKLAIISSEIIHVQSKQRFDVTIQVQRFEKTLPK